MPEGPEVARIALCLNRRFAGKDLRRIDVVVGSKYHKSGGIPDTGPLHSLLPMCIHNIHFRGKRIIFTLTRGNVTVYMISFLSMEGHWLYSSSKHTQLVFTIGTEFLYYDDARTLGWVRFAYNQNDMNSIFDNIGPNYLSGQITMDMYREMITRKRLKNTKIAKFFKEQKYFSDIGNYLRAEILYRCRISPHRRLGELTDLDISNLYNTCHSVILESFNAGGLTIATYADPDGNRGTFRALVYGRPFDDNGLPVYQDKTIDAQTVHWCPSIQV